MHALRTRQSNKNLDRMATSLHQRPSLHMLMRLIRQFMLDLSYHAFRHARPMCLKYAGQKNPYISHSIPDNAARIR